MAPKRAAKKAAAQLPPPAESSDDETRSGSRSRSDESEDEEAIADSPVPAATPALKKAPAPSQKGGDSESSEEESDDDDDEEEEEEEEPARAAHKNQPSPPQKKEDSDASGSDGDEDEEEEEEKKEPAPKKQPPPVLKKQPPPALKKQPPPTPKKNEESDASDEEEEEDEEEAPPPKPAPKTDPKPPAPAAAETKKPGGIQRIWSTNDEVRILEALAAHQKQHGTFPQSDALIDVLAGKLDNPAYGSKELQTKIRSLRHRYLALSRKGEVPSKEHDRQLLHLSKLVWTGNKITSPVATNGTATATVKADNNSQEQKGFEEMCELYPYLAEEVKKLEAVQPVLCKREFGKMDDDKARALDEKIKRQRVAQIKLEMRRSDLAKEVTKALVDLVDV